MIPTIEFWSQNNEYGIRLFEPEINSMLRLCEESQSIETGGVILGKYTTALDCAVVTEITPPPSDSRRGSSWFRRGTRGLEKKLAKLWKTDKEYYLGEWHFHPGGSATLSGTDQRGMQGISETPGYKCPEPILIIIGGSFPNAWEIRAYIFKPGSPFIELNSLNKSSK